MRGLLREEFEVKMTVDAMVRTPEGNFPIAEVYADNGVVYLKFKKAKSQLYEVVTLDQFLSRIYETLEREYWKNRL